MNKQVDLELVATVVVCLFVCWLAIYLGVSLVKLIPLVVWREYP